MRKEEQPREKEPYTEVKIDENKRETPHHRVHEPSEMMVQCCPAVQPRRRIKVLFFIAAIGKPSSPSFLLL